MQRYLSDHQKLEHQRVRIAEEHQKLEDERVRIAEEHQKLEDERVRIAKETERESLLNIAAVLQKAAEDRERQRAQRALLVAEAEDRRRAEKSKIAEAERRAQVVVEMSAIRMIQRVYRSHLTYRWEQWAIWEAEQEAEKQRILDLATGQLQILQVDLIS